MTLDTFIAIVSLVGAVVCYVGYHHCQKYVRLTYKDQRVGGKAK